MIILAWRAAGAFGFTGGFIASVQVGGLVQLVSILAGAIIVIIAGLFTIRAKNAEWWQQSYEAVKAAHDQEKARADGLAKENAALAAEIAALHALPNYDLVVGMLKRSMDAAEAHSKAQVDATEQLTRLMEERLPRRRSNG